MTQYQLGKEDGEKLFKHCSFLYLTCSVVCVDTLLLLLFALAEMESCNGTNEEELDKAQELEEPTKDDLDFIDDANVGDAEENASESYTPSGSGSGIGSGSCSVGEFNDDDMEVVNEPTR
jgi:hypothetical protein